MQRTIQIKCTSGDRSVPVVWQGQTLAIHHPATRGGGISTEPRWWAITHKPSGYNACPPLEVTKTTAVQLAKLWDAAFASVTTANSNQWPLAKRWADDVSRANRGRPLIGPRELTPLEALDSAGTIAEINDAVRRAFGYESCTEAEASEQYPIAVTRKTTGSGAVRRSPDSRELEYWWLPKGRNYSDGDAIQLAGWYTVPTMGDLEDWTFDSIVTTPCGDSVEPDHPDSWLSLLGAI